MDRIQKDISEVRKRVFNGLSKEIQAQVARQYDEVKEEVAKATERIKIDVDKEIKGIRRLLLGLLVSLIVVGAGIVFEGRWSSNELTAKMVKIETQLLDHLAQSKEARP